MSEAELHTPPHLFPFSEGFLEKEARSLLGACGTQWLFPMGVRGEPKGNRSVSFCTEPQVPPPGGALGSLALYLGAGMRVEPFWEGPSPYLGPGLSAL